MTHAGFPVGPGVAGDAAERKLIDTLFELGREVTSVLQVDELLHKIPELIGRLIPFEAFAVYLLDEKGGDLRIAYAVGYPEGAAATVSRRAGQGLVGAVIESGSPILVNDLRSDPRSLPVVEGMQSELVVPLRHKGRVIGALNLLSPHRNQFTEADLAILRQFGAHVAVALVNARLFERERMDAEVFETLAEIGREVAAVLDLDALLVRIAQLARRVIDYRTFGIFLLNERTGVLEIKMAVHYGERVVVPPVPLGEGLVGYAALHREPVLVPDVSEDPRYIKVVEDVRSELAIPMLLKDRCIGVIDLESPERDTFSKRDTEILTVLASQAAVAIENARLYEAVRANQLRLDREIRFAQRVQAALLPAGAPRRLRGIDLAARFAPARELGGDFYDFLAPDAQGLAVAVGDVSGKGVPAALYSAFAGELVRGRTFRRRYLPERSSPAGILSSVNTILHQRQLEEYYCTLCYTLFDLKRRKVTISNSGLPYPIRCSGPTAAQVEIPGVPLGSFPGSTYDELVFPLAQDDIYVFCTDGVYEAANGAEQEYGVERLLAEITAARHLGARELVDQVFESVERFRGDEPRGDDMTIVAVKITA